MNMKTICAGLSLSAAFVVGCGRQTEQSIKIKKFESCVKEQVPLNIHQTFKYVRALDFVVRYGTATKDAVEMKYSFFPGGFDEVRTLDANNPIATQTAGVLRSCKAALN